MGRDTLNFNPRQIVSKELALIREQNDELRNSNKLLTKDLQNGLAGIVSSAQGQYNITSFNPLFQANVYAPLTLNYNFLTYFYKTHGIIQTAIDTPVLDALRGGIEIQSTEMDEDDIVELQEFLEGEDVLLGVVGQAAIWARLYGGGCILINDGASDFAKPLSPDERIRALRLYPASRWELGTGQRLQADGVASTTDPISMMAAAQQDTYLYYGRTVHKSRVLTILGKPAPWLVRWQLQGWGMSECERMVEPFNIYLRTENVIYDLLQEAKTDVFKVDGLRELLMTDGGQQKFMTRLATVQQAKNMNNALVMDKNDDYDQKQTTFAGLAEMKSENRMSIAAALKMPISKIFGVASSGFSSGEDDIENYNAMVESTVRQPIRRPVRQVVGLAMRFLWGQEFQFTFRFKSLRVMSAKDEEQIRDQKFGRVMQMHDRMLMDSEEVGQACHRDQLIAVETKAEKGQLEEFPRGAAGGEGEDEGEGGKKDE